MDADQVYEALAAALRREREAREASDEDLRALQARFDHLFQVLEGQGALNAGHRRLSEKSADRARKGGPRERVRLRQYIDKYTVEGADIDCASRIHVCHARCCSLTFALTKQDLDEGGIRWNLEDPYMIRQEVDGYCSHLDRGSKGCTIHQRRPATCRQFDCRQDPRVWADFDRLIPSAQLTEWLTSP